MAEEFKENISEINLTKEKKPINYVYNEDAGSSKHLAEFDIFFFNNPFGDNILKPVVENIFNSHKDKKCWIYWCRCFV